MSKELPEKIKGKRKVYGTWKEGQAAWEQYRNIVRAFREAKRKAKVHLEINLTRDVKNNKTSTSVTNGRLGKMWICCCMRWVSW